MKKYLILILVILLVGCQPHDELPDKLTSVEIQEYEGEKLDSVEDFRENSIKGPQYIDVETYKLKITGLVEEEKEYTYDEVLENKKYEKVVQLDCVEGWSAKILWEGVLFKDIVKNVVIKENANTVIFHAEDGYTTSFPIEYLFDNDIMVADKMNGVMLPEKRGFPFQLIAESKWGYKWIKWITEIEFSDDEDYEGYWERRGYSNTGNLDEEFYE